MNKYKVKAVVTLGFSAGRRLPKRCARQSSTGFRAFEVKELEEAVKIAYEEVRKHGGGLVLFSTAPSFGYYKTLLSVVNILSRL